MPLPLVSSSSIGGAMPLRPMNAGRKVAALPFCTLSSTIPMFAEHRRPEQSKPPHGAWQAQTPGAAHLPRPRQPLGQMGSSHVLPRQPSAHWHVLGPTQRPFAEHPASQTGVSHSSPPQPLAQRHRLGPRHTPWPSASEQLVWPHEACAQLAPPHPGSHVQTSGVTQRPWPPQSWQRTTSHAAPE